MSVTETFGEYKILKKIATGGMAEVFLARRTGLKGFEKLLAIKRILPQFSENEEFISMFIDEAKLAAQLNHRNIVQIYDFGNQQGAYYIAMEFVSGKDVRSILKRSIEKQKRMPIGQCVYIITEAAKGLEYAHNLKDPSGSPLQLIHRDISPQNILVSYEGEVSLADFGIAKAASKSTETRAGVLKGKILYMSPEQAWGKPIDKRSDLYSLGVVLYEMIAYRKIFDADSEFSMLEKVRNAQVEFPPEIFDKVPKPIFRILKKALGKDPGERYQSAHEMRVDLESYLHTTQETASERTLAGYLKYLFQEEIEEEKKILTERIDSETEAPGEKTIPVESGPQTETKKPMEPSGPKKVPLLHSLKESLESLWRRDVRTKIGALLILFILGTVTLFYLLSEKSPSSLPPIQVSSGPSSSSSPSPSSPGPKIKVDLSTEEPSKGESKPEGKAEPSKEEPAKPERKVEPPKVEPSKEEPVKTVRKAEPSPQKEEKGAVSREEKSEPQPARKGDIPDQKTGPEPSVKKPEPKTPLSFNDLLSQGPALLRQNRPDLLLDQIQKLSNREKENINIRILECFAYLKKWVLEKGKNPKSVWKKFLPSRNPKPPWENLYESLSLSGDRSGTPLLLRIAKDPEVTTRLRAVMLLGSIGDQRAVKDLQQIASSDRNRKIRHSAQEAVSSIQSSSSSSSKPPSSPFSKAQ
jgi:serine/threonine protein kinase